MRVEDHTMDGTGNSTTAVGSTTTTLAGDGESFPAPTPPPLTPVATDRNAAGNGSGDDDNAHRNTGVTPPYEPAPPVETPPFATTALTRGTRYSTTPPSGEHDSASVSRHASRALAALSVAPANTADGCVAVDVGAGPLDSVTSAEKRDGVVRIASASWNDGGSTASRSSPASGGGDGVTRPTPLQ